MYLLNLEYGFVLGFGFIIIVTLYYKIRREDIYNLITNNIGYCIILGVYFGKLRAKT